ncbi:hypothetical protein [Vannielia litorea]|uniref:hypothetical protein n=1 Tax=Vannielia TaxID=2813041 RepID=UPI001C98604B|nr:hypothetical protein [Vannielia litorea]MBY6049434.1 hypothetical protein [Vannielia litorea]MBY6076848.1 hypothetical protein [Vannielia litorea]
MFKTLTATALAAAVALTSFSSPAQAEMDRGETLRLLLGLGAIGALVAANERNKDRASTSRRDTDRVIRVTPGYGGDRYKDRNRHARLPQRCETAVPTRRGTQIFYGQPCLDRSGFRARLPQNCSYTLDLGRKRVKAYEQRCLRRAGYRT